MTRTNTNLTLWWDLTLKDDIHSFKKIHQALFSSLYRYAYNILEEEDQSKDVLQEVFIKLWEQRHRLGPIQNVKVYFFKVTRSIALKHLQKNNKYIFVDVEDHDDAEQVYSHEDWLIRLECQKQQNNQLSAALNELPQRQREMLYLKYYDDLEYQQIAELTGIKYQSVVNHVHRAILQLRDVLAEMHFSNNSVAV